MDREARRPQFFLKWDWQFNLWLPVVGIALATVETIFFQGAIESLSQPELRFVYNLAFLNSTHLILPFVLLISVPQFRQFLNGKFNAQKKWIYRASLFVAVATLFLVLAIDQNVWAAPLTPQVNRSFFWIWILLPTIHGLRQSGGIGILYNQAILENLDREEASALRAFERSERKILWFIYLSTLAALIAQGLNFPIWITASAFSLPAIAAVYYCHLIRKQSFFRNSDKFLYSLRLFFWPMAGYSWAAKLLIGIVHGHEYIALIHKMMTRSSAKVYRRLLATTAVLLALVIGYNIFEYLVATSGSSVRETLATWPMMLVLSVLFPFLAMAHYLVDGLLYRSKDPGVRENILPLIRGSA